MNKTPDGLPLGFSISGGVSLRAYALESRRIGESHAHPLSIFTPTTNPHGQKRPTMRNGVGDFYFMGKSKQLTAKGGL